MGQKVKIQGVSSIELRAMSLSKAVLNNVDTEDLAV